MHGLQLKNILQLGGMGSCHPGGTAGSKSSSTCQELHEGINSQLSQPNFFKQQMRCQIPSPNSPSSLET